MSQIYSWLANNTAYWVPFVLYICLNVMDRTTLVTHANPEVRFIARLLENVLFMQWDKWGGTLKALVPPVNEDVEK